MIHVRLIYDAWNCIVHEIIDDTSENISYMTMGRTCLNIDVHETID